MVWDRYEKEFDSVQDVFELQVCPDSFPTSLLQKLDANEGMATAKP